MIAFNDNTDRRRRTSPEGRASAMFAQCVGISGRCTAMPALLSTLDPAKDAARYQCALLELQNLMASRSFIMQTLANAMKMQTAESKHPIAPRLGLSHERTGASR